MYNYIYLQFLNSSRFKTILTAGLRNGNLQEILKVLKGGGGGGAQFHFQTFFQNPSLSWNFIRNPSRVIEIPVNKNNYLSVEETDLSHRVWLCAHRV